MKAEPDEIAPPRPTKPNDDENNETKLLNRSENRTTYGGIFATPNAGVPSRR